MRPLIVMHVLPEYRLPALEALKVRYPDARVIVSDGGAWASGQNAANIADLADVTVLPARVRRIAGVSLVFFPGLRSAVKASGADVLLMDPRMGLLSIWSLAVWPPKVDGRRVSTVWWFAGWRNRERARYISVVAEALQRQVIRRADGAACYSSAAQRTAISLGIPASRAVLAQNATATSALEEAFDAQVPPARHDDSLHLLYVGRVEERKRLDAVLVAMSAPALAGRCLLRVVGSGPATQGLRAVAHARGVDTSLEIVDGTHDPFEIARHLRWADVGILPNQGGLFLNTAMSCGVPVVCGRADGTEEDLVLDGVTGWRLSGPNADEIEARLLSLLTHRDDVALAGVRARERFHETATLDHMVNGIEEALRRAATGRRGVE